MLAIDYVLLLLTTLLVLSNLIARILKKKGAQFTCNVALLILLAGAISYTLYLESYGYLEPYTLLDIISLNPFSLLFMLLFTLGFFLVNATAYCYSDDYSGFGLLASFALTGMYLVSAANSTLNIFLGLELAGIPAVLIILLSRKSLESATKFFIMGAIAIALFSFAMVLLYGSTNSIGLKADASGGLLLITFIFFIASLGFGSSIFPFNILIPDVYQGAPAYITSMLGGLYKKLGFVALIEIVLFVFAAYKPAYIIIAILASLTMFYGNISAIMQKNLKRMLAYSSISQAGYILIGLASQTSPGLGASLFQIFAHSFAFIGMLSILAWLERRNKTEIDDLTSLSSENRFAALSITIFMLSFIGIPLTTGFFGKFTLFLSAIDSGLLWLALIGIINTILSIYYYSKPIIAIYTRRSNARELKMDRLTRLVVLICITITILFGIFPEPMTVLVNNAASYLFQVNH